MPPEVDPAHPPQSMSSMVTKSEKGPHDSTSAIENPVEVMADTTWNRG